MARKSEDEGGDTRADTPKINSPESDPEFYRDALIGQTIGKCKIESLLGEGKTSVVYKAAYDPLHRTVAVKVLQEHLKKVPAVVKVFQQEGRAVAALDHENILKIYDVGEDHGHHYLVLELLRGKNLLQLLEEKKDNRLSVAEALGYIRQASAGLAAAHRKNLVHRDIKPQNLVLEPEGTLKIVDFGLAAEAQGAFSGGRLGTPHYMSPEQCRGEMAGTASDIYALGITLFHLLVGHPPYSGRVTTEEIIEGHLSGKRLEPEALRPDIPKKVADLVRRMTRQDMQRRPAAAEIRDAIAKTKAERGPTVATVRRGRARRSARRRAKSKSASSGLLILGGVVAVAVVLFLMLGGNGDESQPQANTTQPEAPDPSSPDGGQPEKPPTKVPAKPVEIVPLKGELKREVDELMKSAHRAESTKDWQEAWSFYQRVIVRAPANTKEYLDAKEASEVLKKRIAGEVGGKSPLKRTVSVKESEQAGREFDERRAGWDEQLQRLAFGPVEDEMKTFVARTREHSAERGAMELALKRVGYIGSLVNLLESRAHGLSGGKELWSAYDYNASADLMVMGADAKGIKVKDQDTGAESTLAYADVDPEILIGFIDGLRSGTSAEESLWLGYFCKLVGDARADQYFDFALMSDPGAEVKLEIEALRAG